MTNNTKWMAAAILGIVGMVVVAGAGALVLASSPQGTSGTSGSLTAASEVQYNLTVQVGAVVEGLAVPIGGANVTVWSYSANETNDSVTLTFTKVATALTDANGSVSFSLPAGDYIIVSSYSGLRSVSFVSLQSDESGLVLLHNPLAIGGGHEMRERRGPPMMCEVNSTA